MLYPYFCDLVSGNQTHGLLENPTFETSLNEFPSELNLHVTGFFFESFTNLNLAAIKSGDDSPIKPSFPVRENGKVHVQAIFFLAFSQAFAEDAESDGKD